MKYSKYPSYKDSGVEWLGDVPEGWIIIKMGYLTTCLDGKRIPLNGEQRSYKQGHIPYWGANGIVDYINEYIFDEELVLIGEDGAPFFEKYKDVAFVVNGKIWVNNHAHILRVSNKLTSKFLSYSVNQTDWHLYITGSTRDKLTQGDMNRILLRVPSLNEQQAIANYLDIATDKIDTLISKQTKLIELLKEKRQALISHAVTKGLNPHAKMKQSGVEWLGEIPEDWEVKKLKYNLGLQNQKATINGQEVIALENIESWSGRYIKTESIYQGEDVQYKKGDLLFGKLRPYLAKVFICLNNGIAFGDLLTYRPAKEMDTNFSFYCIISETFIDIVNSSTYGTKMPRASSDFIGEMYMPTPLLQEQQTIANYLDNKTKKIDTLIQKATKAITLLKERRTALISSAVTGKIDVRNMA